MAQASKNGLTSMDKMTSNEEETYDDLLGNNLKNDNDADRFDEVFMGVKKKFKPDWLDTENKMFINKLNFVCKNYEQTHKSVSYYSLYHQKDHLFSFF